MWLSRAISSCCLIRFDLQPFLKRCNLSLNINTSLRFGAPVRAATHLLLRVQGRKVLALMVRVNLLSHLLSSPMCFILKYSTTSPPPLHSTCTSVSLSSLCPYTRRFTSLLPVRVIVHVFHTVLVHFLAHEKKLVTLKYKSP